MFRSESVLYSLVVLVALALKVLVPLRIEKDLRLAGGGEIFYFVVFVCFWVVFFPDGFVVFLVIVTVHRDVLIRAVGVGPLGIDARGIH